MILDDNHHQRTIAHFDLDAFYVACERELNPSLHKKAVAVSQYNPHGRLEHTHSSDIEKRLVAKPAEAGISKALNRDSNGSMIAVSYEARSMGVKRQDRGIDAIKKCPELYIVQVPVKRSKADLTMYRYASSRVMEILISSIVNDTKIPNYVTKRAEIIVEKASIDEIYIDMSTITNRMTNILLSFQKKSGCSDYNLNSDPESNKDAGLKLWKDVINHAKECTTIGGIEVLSNVARAANQLSKTDIRLGSKFQILEKTLDIGSDQWWNRPLSQWTSIELHLACGSSLSAKARNAVRTSFRTNECDVFTLSAGISSNKTLAKLASGLKKPNRQTIINPTDEGSLRELFHPMPLSRIRGLGGKFGESIMESISVATIGDLSKVPLTILKTQCPPSAEVERPVAEFLYAIARGVCMETVSERTVEKSMSSGKSFRGALALSSSNEQVIVNWLSELVGGLLERLMIDFEENKRLASLVSLSIKRDGSQSHSSKSIKAPSELSHEAYLSLATCLYRQFVFQDDCTIQGLTITASNFYEVASGEASIAGFFRKGAQSSLKPNSFTPPKKNSTSYHQNQVKKKKSNERVSEMPPNEDSTTTPNISAASEEAKTKTNTVKNICDVSSTTNSDGIDTSVLSQLPASIQSEIRVANMKRIGGFSMKKREMVSSPMRNWLSSNSSSSSQHLDKIDKKSLASKKTDCHGNEKKKSFIYQSEEIDPNVLAELPFHIQAMISKEMKSKRLKR